MKIEELIAKFPNCEFFISYGEGKYGSCQYKISNAGSTDKCEDFFYIHNNGEIDEYDEWAKRIFDGKATESSITIKLTNGKKLRYTAFEKTIEVLDSLHTKPLTLGLLSDMCNPYTKLQKRQEFADDLKKKVSNVDEVVAIEYNKRIESTFDESDIERLSKTEIAEKLSDITVLRFSRATFVEKTQKYFDYGTNKVKTIQSSEILTIEDPSAGKYEIIAIEYGNPVEKTEDLAGIAKSDYVDMQYQLLKDNTCACT